jgi:hypothetical protein
MAGVKITDLTPLATAASGDLLYIVDVSDTTESPQGTSKKITLNNLKSSLDVVSGTWTPIFSNNAGACGTVTLTTAYYSRVGNIVTCTIYASVDTDFSSVVTGNFDFTFPIAPTSTNARGITSFNQYTNGASDAVIDETIYLRALAIDPFNSTESFVASFQYSLI